MAEDLGKITGVILTGNDGRRGCIYHTSVSPKYRSQRIGSQLLQQALNALKLEGINKVALAVYGYNA